MRNIHSERRTYLFDMRGFDFIMDEYEGNEFSEFVVSIGGDVETYRVYGNDKFEIYCK